MNDTTSQNQDPIAIEATGSAFSRADMLRVRKLSIEAVRAIGYRIRVGMSEEEAREVARRVLVEHGLRRGWHQVLVRFGRNTLKPFREPSEPNVHLQENDIFFVDIGPVLGKCEGDAGGTFVRGDDPDMLRCAHDVERIFHQVRSKWLADRVSGVELYAHAERAADALGWRLNLNIAGHRLSEFPHHAHYAGPLAGITFPPSAVLWVLEIQIRHPARAFGAFFEDLLLEDEHFA